MKWSVPLAVAKPATRSGLAWISAWVMGNNEQWFLNAEYETMARP